jgi:hypothetical protein
MSFTRSESERLARLKGCTTGIYCRYGRPSVIGITGPTGPAGYSFFTLGGNQGSLAPSTGSFLVVNMSTSGQTGSIGYSNILQASQAGYTGSAPNPSPYVKVDSDIIPAKNNIYSIGSRDMQFKSAYFGANTVYIDGVPIGSTGGTTIIMPSSVKIGDALLTASGDTLVLPYTVRLGSINGPILGATGPTGPSGSGMGADGGMEWITKHLLENPPSIEFELPIVVRSSEIFIGWKYPEQDKLSFMDIWVPAIFGFNAKVNYKENGTASRTDQTMISVSSTNIDAHKYIDMNGQRYVNIATAPIITGLILTTVDEQTGYQPNIPWPGTQDGSRNVFRYYSAAFENLDRSDPNNKIEVHLEYTNLSTRPTTGGSIAVNLFISAGPPGPPRGLTGAASGSQAIGVNFKHPERTDLLDEKSKAIINKYIITYSTDGSPIRYGGPVAHGPITVEPAISAYNMDQTMTYSYSNLHPESEYTFDVRAVNSANLDGSSALVKISTGILGAPVILNGLGLDPTQFYGPTIRRVQDGALITNLVNSIASNGLVKSTEYTIAIHLQGTRASTATGLAVATAALEGGPTASITYDGFSHSAPSDVSNGGLAISVSEYKDNYTALSQQGFYLRAKQRVSLEISGNVVPSPNPYQFVFTQTNYDGSSSTPIYAISTSDNIPGISKANYQFYYDSPPLPIEIHDVSWSLFSSDTIPVCGINIVGRSYQLNVITTLKNYNNYFYRSPFLEYYNTENTLYAGETDVSGILNISNKLTDTIIIYRTSVNNNTQLVGNIPMGYYSKKIGFRVNAHNLHLTTESPEEFINLIVDRASYDLLTDFNKYPNIIQHFEGTTEIVGLTKPGRRIKSGISQGGATNPYVPPFTMDITDTFNNSASIKDTEELQIFRGKYRANKLLDNTDGYIDYSGFVNNSLDYSTIDTSGYRFATFRWDLDNLPNGLVYNTLVLKLYKTEGITIDTINNIASVGSKKLVLYYRFIEEPNFEPKDYSSLTTSWINGNFYVPELTSGSFIVPPDNSYSLGGLLTTPALNISSGDITFDERIHVLTSRKMILICRVGLPMGSGASFEYISASLNIS